jgi:hypothetical protein
MEISNDVRKKSREEKVGMAFVQNGQLQLASLAELVFACQLGASSLQKSDEGIFSTEKDLK